MARNTALPEQHDRAPQVSTVTEILWCLGCCRDQPQTLIRRHSPRTVVRRCTGCGQTAARQLDSEQLLTVDLADARAQIAARDAIARMRRALAGHLFDGESLSTREAIREELIKQGLLDGAAVAEIRYLHILKNPQGGHCSACHRPFPRPTRAITDRERA